MATRGSTQWKENLSAAHLGLKWTKQHKVNFIKVRTGKKHKGGWHHSEASKIAIGNGHIGAKNHNWKNGISDIDHSIRRMPEYLEWRYNIFKRDNWTCIKCEAKKYVTAHHIKSFSKLIKENGIKTRDEARNCPALWDLKNGKTLCEKCHSETDNYRGKAKKL